MSYDCAKQKSYHMLLYFDFLRFLPFLEIWIVSKETDVDDILLIWILFVSYLGYKR